MGAPSQKLLTLPRVLGTNCSPSLSADSFAITAFCYERPLTRHPQLHALGHTSLFLSEIDVSEPLACSGLTSGHTFGQKVCRPFCSHPIGPQVSHGHNELKGSLGDAVSTWAAVCPADTEVGLGGEGGGDRTWAEPPAVFQWPLSRKGWTDGRTRCVPGRGFLSRPRPLLLGTNSLTRPHPPFAQRTLDLRWQAMHPPGMAYVYVNGQAELCPGPPSLPQLRTRGPSSDP